MREQRPGESVNCFRGLPHNITLMNFRISITFICLGMLISQHFQAQSALYDQLDTALIPSQLLRNKAPQLFPWQNYTGVNPDTLTTYSAFKQLFFEAKQAEIEEFLPELTELWQSAENWQRIHGSIPLIILDLEYAQVLADAEENGLIGFENGHYIDLPTDTSPYSLRPLLAAFPTSESFPEAGTELYIGPEFYFTNTDVIPAQLSLNLNGVTNTVTMGSSIAMNNLQSSLISLEKTIGGSTQITYFNWKVTGCDAPFSPDPAPWTSPDPEFPWLIQTEFEGELIEGNAYVKYHYGQASPELDRVFVFVEGIDFNTSHTLSDHRFGDFGWCQFVSGNAQGYEFLYNAPSLIDFLRSEDYDIILLDFKKGADYIQKNAALLRSLIHKINDYKIGKEPITLAGASMGGQITRYALASMDQEGLPHCVDMWISLDSPHTGANIPLGFQEMLQSLANNPNPQYAEVEEQLANTLDRPAARQMLMHQREGYSLFDAYYDELESLEWPREVVSFGIANGNGEGIGLNIADEHLFLFEINDPLLNEQIAWMKCLPAPGDENGLISSVHMPSEYLNLGYPCADIPIAYSGNDVFHAFDQAIDECPGSKRSTIGDFAADFMTGMQQNPCANYDPPSWTLHHTFVPTKSALAMSGADLFEHVEYEIQTGMNHTPFDLFCTGEDINQAHSRISELALEQLMRYRSRANMLEEELTAFHPNGGVYNMNLIYRSSLNDLTVYNGGSLYLNADLPAEYAEDPGSLPDECFTSNLTVRTNQCSAYIEVGDEGYIQVGSGDEDLKAELEIRSGSVLKVRDGGHLRITSGSNVVIRSGAELLLEGGSLRIEDHAQLIIEPGALLRFDEGSQLHLDGAEAVLELSGHLHLGEDATFSILHSLGASGKLRIQPQAEWITGDNDSKIELWGDYPQDQVIEVMEGASLLINESVSELNLSSCRINLHANTLLNCATDLEALDVVFDGNDESEVSVWKAALFRDCRLDQLRLLAFQAEDVLRIERSVLENVETTISGMGYRIYESLFTSSYISSDQLSINSRIVDSSFEGNNSYDIGIREGSMITLHLKNTSISGYETGVEKSLGELKAQCSEFSDCSIAIAARPYASLNLSKPIGGGGNRFNNNQTHILLDRASQLHVFHGANDFDGASEWAIYGTLLGSCDQTCSSIIFGTGNVWNVNGQNTPENAGIYLIRIDSECDLTTPMSPEGGCEINIEDKLPIALSDCSSIWNSGAGEKPISAISTGLEGGDPPTSQDPLINTEHYTQVPMSKALYHASSYLTANDPVDGQDLFAISLLYEILNSDLDHTVPWVRQLSSAGVFLMRTAVEDMWSHGSELQQDSTSFTPGMIRYVDVLNSYTLTEVPRDLYADQFGLELHKPAVFGILKAWPTGLELMKEVDDCGLDSLEQTILNNEIEKAALHTFLSEIPAEYHHPDSLYLHTPSEDLEQALDNDLPTYGFGAWIQSPCSYLVYACPFWELQSATESKNNDFDCFPSPAVSNLTVALNGESELPDEVAIYNALGRRLLHFSHPNSVFTIDVSHFSNGTYIVQAIWVDGEIKLKKFQVQR